MDAMSELAASAGHSGPGKGTRLWQKVLDVFFSPSIWCRLLGNEGPEFCASVPQAEGSDGMGDTLGPYTVAPFVQTHSTKQHFLSACLLMLVIVVVTGRGFQPEGHTVGEKSSGLESEILGPLAVSSVTLV